jgi:hypothetical protein
MAKPEMNVGEFLDTLKGIDPDYRYRSGDTTAKTVEFDFCWFYPTTFNSWRGDYSVVALGFDGQIGHASGLKTPTVRELVATLVAQIGTTMTGWKGGDYTISRDRLLRVANPGNTGCTVIVGVKDVDYRVIIQTRWRDTY